MRFVYHDGYDLNLGAHVFPSQKYRLIRDRLLANGLANGNLVRPDPASEDDLLRVHDRGWIQRLRYGTLSYEEIVRLEIPYSRQMVKAFWLAAGGTILAARHALTDGIGYNIGGGFHHAFPGHGEGFCAIHDVAVAIRKLQSESLIQKALIVDCDVHHGNGTAGIFGSDPDVFTLSIHQFNNYPSDKPPSTLDIHLEDGTGDQEYLQALREAYATAVSTFRPDIVFYVAGADPYMEDQLGGLNLSLEGLKARDRLVFEVALSRAIPVVVTLAGGYAQNVEDTVTIHTNTAQAAQEVLFERGYRARDVSL